MDFAYLKNLVEGYPKEQILHDLMTEYGQDVWNFAYSLVKKHNIADDISQDVFVKAYFSLETFRGASSAKTWLLAITRHAVLDYRKTAFIRKVTLVHYISHTDTHPSAEREYLENLALNDVWKVVMTLPIKLREVLVLYAQYDLTVAEISDLLKVSQTAVKVRLHRARKKVSKNYNESEEN